MNGLNSMPQIDPLLDQLNDIVGLGPIPFWPPAIGWWIALGFGILILSITARYFIKWLKFRRSWKYDSIKKLNSLLANLSRHSLNEAEIQDMVIEFSEYLRRIALHKVSRNACAGLIGDAWLKWLFENDEKKFDWAAFKELLVQAPYAPLSHPSISSENSKEQLKVLIHAAKELVC